MVGARRDDLIPISIQSAQNGIKKQKTKQTNRKHPANGSFALEKKKKQLGKGQRPTVTQNIVLYCTSVLKRKACQKAQHIRLLGGRAHSSITQH